LTKINVSHGQARHYLSVDSCGLPTPMIPFTYRCPRTGQQVQGWAADDLTNGEIYEPVTCTACARIHLVNPKSGKVLESAKK
jgi:hypothetical protein